MTSLRAERLGLSYDKHRVVEELDLELPTGKVTAIVGANGCGKSTLLRGLSRVLAPTEGRVLLGGDDLHRMPPKQVARHIALLPQHPVAPSGMSVAELIGMGRHPHQSAFRPRTREDDRIVAEAMEATDTVALAERPVEELSGGQRQRVWIAMVVAQHTDILLLDEPTSFLDLAHAVDVLDLVTDLNRERGTTVAMVLHDLNLAARYADHLVAMKGGAVLAEGSPAKVITTASVKEIFGMTATVLPDPVTGTPLVVPIGRHHRIPAA
ncbi:ABC transporter ATP-binding protein [Yimella sp. cx-51]|uniref:ABC transporter ATP-binding protein n=1 Tax=Yimella sp. cx-51 TaxID=2770551 RepID=UPI00165DFE7B|nr:ABC transporter ATP-binding protein [Yimella sp. cx-51]MBC9956557.1 ABC transporter ATP-binding protein [Yimella sp. cx-51]QTH38340.1 ABC transporter ATP-binding protein [Yimella sp. cx-51]